MTHSHIISSTKKEQVTCKVKWRNSSITMSRNQRWHWDDNKGGWLDAELCAKARREEAECIRRHKTCTRVPREACLRETGRTPIQTGWAETDRGQSGKPNVPTRWVAKEYKTHARPEFYASKVEEKLWHWLTCEGRTSTLQHEEEYSSNCCQKITRQGTNRLYGTRHAHKIARKSLHRHSAISS